MGRVNTYTPEIGEAICERAITRSLHSVCKDDDMPAESTVYGWMVTVPEFGAKYARAREARSYRRYESIDELTDAIRSGELKPDAGRVLIDAIKWQTSKEAPKVFGEKLELSGNKDAPLTVQVVRFSDVDPASG